MVFCKKLILCFQEPNFGSEIFVVVINKKLKNKLEKYISLALYIIHHKMKSKKKFKN